MKASFLAENIVKNLSFVNHAVSTKTQLPILTNLLIEAKNEKLIICATDLEIGIITQNHVKIKEEGETTIPAKAFTDLILSLSCGKVNIETKEGSLVVSTEKTKSVFQTMPVEEFPKLYEEKGDQITEFEAQKIHNNIKKIVFAASSDSSRPALSGVLIKKEKKKTTMVATDGYRLSLQEEKEEDGEGNTILIPARLLKEVLFFSGDEKIALHLSSKTNQIIFEQNGITLIGRTIDSPYPAYEKIIPVSFETQSIFDKEEMQKAVKICSIFARETANIIKLSFKKDKIIVSANTPSTGENIVEVEAKTTGEENEIAFNARYVLDLLANLDSETVSFEMTGPLNPGVFKIPGDASFLHLIMPIRVQS